MFQDESQFEPSRHGKVPLHRTPFALAARLIQLTLSMLFSRDPGDLLCWLRSMLQRRWPMSYARAWLTFDATREITQRVGPSSRVCEFGSGHSTLYWAKLGAEVYSVEDHLGWFELVQRRIAAFPTTQVPCK